MQSRISIVALACFACGTSTAPLADAGPADVNVLDSAGPPSLSTDALVFDSDQSGAYALYTMASDGSATKLLYADPSRDCFWGKISPSRTKVIFTCTPKGIHDTDYTKASIWIVDADGSNGHELRPVGTDGWSLQGHEEWSPDGNAIAVAGGLTNAAEIFLTDVAGKNAAQVTHWGTTTTDVSWNPNGAGFVTNSCDTQGVVGCAATRFEIWSLAIDGGGPKRLTNDSLPDYDPYYSPDGSQIAWLVETGGILKWGIYLMSSDGSNRHALIDDGNINSKPAWSAQGDRIYFHRHAPSTNGKFHVFAIHADGTGLVDLTPTIAANCEYPDNR